MNILFEIQNKNKKEIIDSLSYYDHLTEYPVADIIDFNWKNILDNPEKNSSSKTYKELLEVYNKSNHRTAKELDLIKKIDQDANYILYEFLKQVNIKFPFEKFYKLYSILEPIIINTKNIFNRARPKQLGEMYNLDINVWTSDTHHTPSYPSGHTIYTRLGCNIIMDKFPNLKNELNKITKITANCRIAQGVHYFSDNKASIIFADYFYNRLKEKIYG